MEDGKQAYREFLKSDFWKLLSLAVRTKVGRCQKCGGTKVLQAHHVRYPKDWYQTKEADLKVLCRSCHRKAHLLKGREKWAGPCIIYRDDWKFSVITHRIEKLSERVRNGGHLRDRDERFLDNAMNLYPPEPTDTCMQFKVDLLRRTAALYQSLREQGKL